MDDLPPVNILLVDDEPKNLVALEAILAAEDRRLIHAGSGQEALRHLLHDDFAVILLDVHMPEMDGFEAAELIRGRERSRETPIIFLTAELRNDASVARGYSIGAVDYILKPFDPDILRSKVGVFVELFKKTERLKRAEFERAQLAIEQTARAEAEAARDRLQQVVDVLPEGIAIADLDGHVVMSNGVAREIIGYVPMSAAGPVDAISMLHLDGTPCPPDELPLARIIRDGVVVRGEQLLIPNAATGQEVPVLVNGAPLRDASGAIVGGVVVFQDISSIKELEREKDAFLAAASHDMKNPLAAIKARAQILQRRAARLDPSHAEPMVEGLRGIDQTATRLSAMINELLDAARLQMGRPLDLDRRPTDLAELARRVAEELQPASDRHRITVEASAPELIGEWDRARLERVLTNLVSNAVKYSPEGGLVKLEVMRERDHGDEWAVVRVRDRGIGIPADELPHVFDRFYRGSNVGETIEGTGLGLAGVHQIVEQHGGTVLVESQERVGSTFTVRLPLRTPPERGAVDNGQPSDPRPSGSAPE